MTNNGLVNEINEYFAAGVCGFREVKALPNTCKAWTVIDHDVYGIAILNPYGNRIDEQFSNVVIESRRYALNGENSDMLVLLSSNRNLRQQFALLCSQFAEAGEDRANRNELETNPFLWWRKWCELLGNRMAKQEAYDTIAEMLVVDFFLKMGEEVSWGGPGAGTHDIDTSSLAIEVKSTVKKYGASIRISSQRQMEANKPLRLYFVRLEACQMDGVSIDDMAEQMICHGYDRTLLELQLASKGFSIGRDGRSNRYRILEKRWYIVDENFPKIIGASFVNGHIPQSITHIEYTVDLDGLTYESWE